jgi:hypothetical protein
VADPETLIKYVRPDTAQKVLGSGTLRWSSPELFDEPWSVRLDPHLGFDHQLVSQTMLKAATGMIFARDMPEGNLDHPLFKAIRRWRAEERFQDETEAFEALSELLAPTPETVRGKLLQMLNTWRSLVETARVTCLAESHKDLNCWRLYAQNHRGAALRFSCDGILSNPIAIEYSKSRPKLTTLKEQVEDLVGIKKAPAPDNYVSKLFTKSRADANEKEWRCFRQMNEEDLDCGEDVEDWYQDIAFAPRELKAIYLGFMMPKEIRADIIATATRYYPKTTIYQCQPMEDAYELEFTRFHAE